MLNFNKRIRIKQEFRTQTGSITISSQKQHKIWLKVWSLYVTRLASSHLSAFETPTLDFRKKKSFASNILVVSQVAISQRISIHWFCFIWPNHKGKYFFKMIQAFDVLPNVTFLKEMSCFAFTRAITRDTSNRVGEYIIHKAAMFAHIPESKLWKVI